MSSSDLVENPERHMPDLSGKVILVTGGTNGLGAKTVLALAQRNPATIYLTGRNASAAKDIIEKARASGSRTQITFLQSDMTDLATVRDAADKVLAAERRLDVLMANAGIMAKPPALTKDGYELQFGTNHLGNALFVRKLLPLLESTAAQGLDARVIVITSLGWQGAPTGGILFDDLKTPQDMFFGSWFRYGQSKLANLIYAKELAKRYPEITSVSVTPGVVQTDLVTSLPWAHRAFVAVTTVGMKRKAEEGAWSQLWCVAAPKTELQRHNGGFFEPVGIVSDKTSSYTEDPELANKLWDFTEEVLAPFLT
ncbi:dehydrogenase with different specificitie [Xylaria sp. FL1777]|nr:dehydrogenase with different specificitie [Xylaria sp. FL1777]